MKPLLALLAFILLCLPSRGQTFVYQKPLLTGYSGVNQKLNFAYHYHKPGTKKMIIGGIMLGSGVLVADGGLITYLWALPHGDHPVSSPGMQTFGIVAMAGGAAILTTGIVLLVKGRQERKHGYYGLELIAPRNNEIGLAYNF